MKYLVPTLMLTAFGGGVEAKEQEAKKPNILFVAIDDLRPELGCYGGEHIISPNIDKLAAEGVIFDRAYCQMAICMASRKSLMSGFRPINHNLHDRKALIDNLPDEKVLALNEHFQNNGYETVNIGKIYHSAEDNATGWTRNFRDIKGPWGSRGYVNQESLKINKAAKKQGGKGPTHEAADVDDLGYQTGAFAQKAIEELRNINDKPLFLALGFRKPHLPFNAPKKYWDMYDPKKIQLTKNPNPPQGKADENYTNFGELKGYHGVSEDDSISEEQARTLIHGYYACVSYVDAQLGKVLDELKRLDLERNTIVMLWTDHGWKLGDYGWWCKHTANEIDTRVPLIVKAPNKPGNGKRSGALVELIDMYPTLCDLAEIPTPEHVQGHSFAPLLNAPDRTWKKAAFSIWAGKNPKNVGYTMRSGKYRYTEWRTFKDGELLSRELYDHSKGSFADKNLAVNPENRPLVEKLSKVLNEGYTAALPEKE